MKVSQKLAWAAFAWGVISTALCFYWGIAWDAPYIALSGMIGFFVVSVLVWLVNRHWILISIPLAMIAIPASGAGLNPAVVFGLSCLVIIAASVIDFFEVQGARIRSAKGT